MPNFFTQFLVDNIWASPKGDWQFPITPMRMSPDDGFINTCQLAKTNIALPTKNETYHLFQVGRYNPQLLKLLLGNGTWQSFADIINNQNVYAQTYTDYGLTLSLSDVYFRFDYNKSLYIAVRWNSAFELNYNELTTITIRFITASFIDNSIPQLLNQYSAWSGLVTDDLDRSSLDQFAVQYPSQNLLVYINGFLSDLNAIAYYDQVDVIFDPLYKQSTVLRLNELPVFNSDMDKQRKYLFHVTPLNENDIDFINNIDFYLTAMDTNGNQTGLYIHRNNIRNVRNVTFHDYSIMAYNVQNLLTYLPLALSNYELYITAFIRKSGFNTGGVIDTKEKLLSLYDFPDDLLTSLLANLNSDSLWNASNLEKSATLQFIQCYLEDLNNYNTEEVGGYLSITNQICPPLAEADSNWVTIPPCYQDGFTVAEFSNGLLSGLSYNQKDGKYQLVNPNTDHVEFTSGIPTTEIDLIYSPWIDGSFTVPLNIEYRVYGQDPENGWIDITNLVSSEQTSSGTVLTYPTGYTNIIVKNNGYQFVYSKALPTSFSNISIQLDDPYMSYIPYGVIDVYLNGYLLVHHVDYIVIGNTVYLCNYEQMKTTYNNLLYIKCQGFCDSNLKLLSLDTNLILENTPENINSLNEIIATLYRAAVVVVNNTLYTGQSYPDSFLYICIKTKLVNAYKYLGSDSQTLLTSALDTNEKISLLKTVYMPDYSVKPLTNYKKTLISPFLYTILENLLAGEYDQWFSINYTKADLGNFFYEMSQVFYDDPIWNSVVNYDYYQVVGFNTAFTVNLNAYQFKFFIDVVTFFNNSRIDYLSTLTNTLLVF